MQINNATVNYTNILNEDKNKSNLAQNSQTKGLSFSQTFTITAKKVEKHFEEGEIRDIYPTSFKTPFSSELSQKQRAVSESEYLDALSRIKELIDEINHFVSIEQGENSELGYYTSTMNTFFTGQIQGNQATLNDIKSQIKASEIDDEALIKSIDNYFMLGTSTAINAMTFFDYVSDKIQGLPTAQIMQDLSIIKGYWDNNSTQSLKLDDGTTIGFTQILDSQGKAQRILFINNKMYDKNIEFDENTLKDKNLGYLFEVFRQRERLNSIDLSKNLQTNFTFDNANLLKELLQGIESKTQ